MINLSEDLFILDSANNQDLGLMMVKENRPDLLFIKLPYGWERMSKFISNVKSESPSTKCILIIEHFEEYLEALKSGADDILESGFTIAKLNQVSQRLCSTKNSVR
jgi:DNA-binding NtrC family response regulator